MHAVQSIALSALLLTTGAATADGPQCPDGDAPPAPVCIASQQGLAYADSDAEAAVASEAIEVAAHRFAAHFGQAPTGVLVLSTTLDSLAAQDFARTQGLDYAQVWLPANAKRAMTGRAMQRAGVERSRIRQALAQSAQQDQNMLQHEVGHALYGALFWPDAERALAERYGTPAPDWLDEAVAVLMEGPEAQARHVAMFIDVATREPQRVPPLSRFIGMENPVRSAGLAQALARGPKSGSGVQMTVSTDSDSSGLDTFYGQSLLLALFLSETSGNPRILAPISTAIAGGTTVEDWLARDGTRHDLPDTLPALQKGWNAWIEQVLQRPRGSDK